MKEVKLVRLSSGEEILAQVVGETVDSIRIEKPIALYAAEEGKIGFMPYIPYTKAADGLDIKHQHVLYMVDPIDQILDQYNQATSSIVTQPQGIIV